MGLQNRNNTTVYVRLKEQTYSEDGKQKTKYGFIVNKDDIPYSELEGTVKSVYYRNEEYEGQKIRKFVVILEDDELYNFSVNVETSVYPNLVGFLSNIDVNRPITMIPMSETVQKDGKEYSKRAVLISQDGQYMKSYFNENNPLPKWNMVKINNKMIADKTDFLNALEEHVTNNLATKFEEFDYKATKQEDRQKPQQEQTTTNALPWEDESDLPF